MRLRMRIETRPRTPPPSRASTRTPRCAFLKCVRVTSPRCASSWNAVCASSARVLRGDDDACVLASAELLAGAKGSLRLTCARVSYCRGGRKGGAYRKRGAEVGRVEGEQRAELVEGIHGVDASPQPL